MLRKRSASSTVSISSLTGTPSQPSGLSALPMALAICSGGVVVKHRLADWRAVKRAGNYRELRAGGFTHPPTLSALDPHTL